MDEVGKLYNDGKLLVRAMDTPQLRRGANGIEYDCSTWGNEFSMLQNGKLSSASSTLVVPGVCVSTYKSIGFLIDSDLAECFHISKLDSGSSGNLESGDFFASKADFNTISELANYIASSKGTNMNEVNINASIDAVKGLFFNECSRQDLLLQMTYVVKTCLKKVTGLDYPIYSYDIKNGKMNHVEITKELEEQITSNLKGSNFYCWPEGYEEPVTGEISNSLVNTY